VDRLWLAFLATGALAVLAYFFVPPLAGNGLFFNAMGLSAAVAIAAGARRHRPAERTAWYLFAAAQVLFVVGDAFYYTYPKVTGTDVPFPSAGDVFYLAVYPLLVAGVVRLIRARSPRPESGAVIDALIVGTGVGLLSWVYLMAPYAHDPGLTAISRVVSMAYPLMDLLLLVVAARLAIGPGRREPAFHLLVAAVTALFATDAIYGYITLNGTYETGSALDVGWLVYYFCWGAAALHPSMRSLGERGPDHRVPFTRGRRLVLTGMTLMAPAVMVIQAVRDQPLDLSVTVTGSVALFVLAMARMGGIVAEHEWAEDRERTLREAGAALVTVTTTEATYEAAVAAVRRLAGPEAAVRRCAHGPDGLPEAVRGALGHRQPVRLDRDGALWAALDLPPAHPSAVLAPLFVRGSFRGCVVASTPVPARRELLDGMAAVASQASLALDALLLAEGLHRRRNEARFHTLVQHSSDVVTVVDAHLKVAYMSPSAERVFGYDPAPLLGRPLLELVHPEDRPRVAALLARVSQPGVRIPEVVESRVRRRDGSWAHTETLWTNLLHDPEIAGVVLNTRDISERKAVEEELAHQAFHDSVTGLANRALFRDRVEHALERQHRVGSTLSVLFVDIDDFKTVNDSLGHAAGDRLLVEVARRLKTCVRAADTAARLGGDEFGLLLEDAGEAATVQVAEHVLAALDPPCLLDGQEVFVRASVGIRVSEPGHLAGGGAEGAEPLLRDADAAMYMAKSLGKNRYQLFESTMHERVVRRLELGADLQRATENGEFILHFQPVVELATGAVSGFESLIRWAHPGRGVIAPADFVSFAEETGLIIPIGRWVLEEACRRARSWQERFPDRSGWTVAVNLSARQLQHPGIAADVEAALARAGLDPALLVIEITESVMMRDTEASAAKLGQLKDLGVKVAIDDFGTGYSSLTYIREFPIDILKVDKTFVDRMNESREDAAVTSAIMGLAAVLDLVTVAEGIESPAQADQLLRLGCTYGQGFHFSRPIRAEEVEGFLAARLAGERAA
jgi:diguanylate cyclase (GGDEF)-like protein/PAS domain S-box-containing protein